MKLKPTIAVFAAIFASSVLAAPVNINTASAAKIAESLSGIGARKAEAIVQYRDSNGHFKSASDIISVKGIGQSIFVKNKQDILIK